MLELFPNLQNRLYWRKQEANMQVEYTDTINAPLEEVYKLVKYDLQKIVKYLPNIEEIQVLEQKKVKNKDFILNQWTAEAKVPSLAKKFINKELFSWKDCAYWDDSKFQVKYEIEPFFAKGIYEAKGCNSFKADGDKTELTLRCDVEIYPDKIPGIPKFIAKKIHPIIETMIENMLAPNVTSLSKGIKDYLKDKDKKLA